jgi:hypothetical protein
LTALVLGRLKLRLPAASLLAHFRISSCAKIKISVASDILSIGLLSHGAYSELFEGHFDREVIILCVRWYLRFKLSLRDLVEMMAERGLSVAHTTIMRWVQLRPGVRETLAPVCRGGRPLMAGRRDLRQDPGRVVLSVSCR